MEEEDGIIHVDIPETIFLTRERFQYLVRTMLFTLYVQSTEILRVKCFLEWFPGYTDI